MFNILKKKTVGQTVTFKIDGMHCTSCAMSIDGELEEIKGVISAETRYAQSQTSVIFDPAKTDITTIQTAIEALGYTAINAQAQ
jgi:copper chaperone CopZ